MLRKAVRAALMPRIVELAPEALTDALGEQALPVYFEDVTVSSEVRVKETHWKDCTAVVVLYIQDDNERLVHHLALAPLSLSHAERGLTATGSASFKSLKEGFVQGTGYAELRFSVTGTIKGEAEHG